MMEKKVLFMRMMEAGEQKMLTAVARIMAPTVAGEQKMLMEVLRSMARMVVGEHDTPMEVFPIMEMMVHGAIRILMVAELIIAVPVQIIVIMMPMK